MSVPYHTRSDSKPFSYSVRSRSSSLNRHGDDSSRDPPISNGLSSMGLASPRLIRKMLGESSSQNTPNTANNMDSNGPSSPENIVSPSYKSTVTISPDINNGSLHDDSEENFREIPIQKSNLDFYELSRETIRDSNNSSFGFDMKRSSFDDFISKKKTSPDEDPRFPSQKTVSPEDIYATVTTKKPENLFSVKSPSEVSKKSALSDFYSSTTAGNFLNDDHNPFEDFDTKKFTSSSLGTETSFASKIGSETYHVPIKLERSLNDFESPLTHSSMTEALLNKSNDESWLEKQLQKLKERKGVVLPNNTNSSYNSSSSSSNLYKSPTTTVPIKGNGSTYTPLSQYTKSSILDESDRGLSDSEDRGVRVPIIRDDKPYSSELSSSYTHQVLERQKSDGAFSDRSRPSSGLRRQRMDSESSEIGALDTSSLHQKLMAASLENGSPSSRPITPAFPPGTPYNNRSRANTRAPSPCGLYSTSQRRGSVGSVHSSEVSGEESATNVKLVKDNFKYWYKPSITREEAISLLKHRPAGTFIVRDSHSFPGAYGLALKVSKPPPASSKPKPPNADPLDELVRHFLIEPTTKGVRLKGYSNEPIFASLSSLVYQHSLTALALPTKLVLPQYDLTMEGSDNGLTHPHQTKQDSMRRLFDSGAACNVSYLFTMETDALTGSVAVDKTVSTFLELTKDIENNPGLVVVDVHFKVTTQGITITDNERKLFFRKHYSISTIGYCGLDPQNRTYAKASPHTKIFAFVAKKHGSRTLNQCHLFAAVDPEQPAVAIVNFVNRVMAMTNPKRIEVV